MKNIFYSCVVLLTCYTATAQLIFDQYANSDEVSYISISPKMFQMVGRMSIDIDDPNAEVLLNMAMSVSKFKVLISNKVAVIEKMNIWIDDQVNSSELETLMTVNDEGINVVFYIEENSSRTKVERFIMFSKMPKFGVNKNQSSENKSSVESVLLLLEGDVDLDQISRLAKIMDLPGSKQLDKMNKKQFL